MDVQDLAELPTSVLVQLTLALARTEPVLQSDEYWAHVRVLHFRSGRDVFDAAAELCSSQDEVSRAIGADVLAQLGVREGVPEFPFAEESEAKLVALLRDTKPTVTASALYALGHLGRGEPSQLAGLATHASDDVRCALAYALGGRTDAVSSATLIQLSADADPDTRNWATFTLGSLSEEDSPAIRDALVARLTDADDEVRGEAILGLARRQDECAFQPLLRELRRRDVGTLAIEAAAAMPRSEFIPDLEALHAAHSCDQAIQEALDRCREVARSR